MGKGSSSQKTSNTYNNYNLQGTEADNVIVGSNNTLTDHGAVQASLNANQTVSLASIEHSSDVAETAMGYVYDASKMAVNASGEAVYAVSEAWRDSSKMAVSATNSAAELISESSAANLDRINTINQKASDRIEKMATAVATDGQNLIAQNNVKNLYIIGGVSALSVIAMAVMAARGK